MKLKNRIFFYKILILLFLDQSVANAVMNIPTQTFNQTLHNKLPAHILAKGEIVVANDGTSPPFIIYTDDNHLEGLNVDLMQAVSEILGVKIKHEQVAGFAAVMLGIQSGRYDMTAGPVSDTPERQKNADFIAFARSYAAFAVLKDNPAGVASFADSCGKKISVQSGTALEKTLSAQSALCVEQGHSAIDIKIFKDQSLSLLALKSGRVDACFMPAPVLGYYISLDHNLALVDAKRNTPARISAAMVAKDSSLGPLLLASYQILFDNGTYQRLMTKWGVTSEHDPGTSL